jgi:CheY-like chemotaxis protein
MKAEGQPLPDVGYGVSGAALAVESGLTPAHGCAETRHMARVLVVEDDSSISQLLRIVLETAGHEVLAADDGSRGLAMATRRSPDVILLDVMMPFMDGFAVLEALRQDERTLTIPVVMLSAIQKESVEERCYRLGAQAFVRKPFDPDILLGTIEEVVAVRPELAIERTERRLGEVPLSVILAWRGGV